MTAEVPHPKIYRVSRSILLRMNASILLTQVTTSSTCARELSEFGTMIPKPFVDIQLSAEICEVWGKIGANWKVLTLSGIQ